MRILGLGTLTSLLIVLISCETYVPPAGDDYVFHDAFDFGEAHVTAGCDACHIEAATLMLIDTWVPDTPNSAWQTQLQVDPLNSCASCHPFIRNGLESEEATVDCGTLLTQWLADCDLNANATPPALLTSERCRYETYHASPPNDRCVACHGLAYDEWNFSSEGVNKTCPDGGVIIGDPHAADGLFPTVNNGHAGLACADCHPAGQGNSTLNGQGNTCATSGCHSRLDAGVPGGASHYPADAGSPESSRDCKTCHVSVLTDYQAPFTQVVFTWPNTFADHTSNHGNGFLIEHGANVEGCESCHNLYLGQDPPDDYAFTPDVGRSDCLNCHTDLDVVSPGVPAHATVDQTSCTSAGCHPDGRLP